MKENCHAIGTARPHRINEAVRICIVGKPRSPPSRVAAACAHLDICFWSLALVPCLPRVATSARRLWRMQTVLTTRTKGQHMKNTRWKKALTRAAVAAGAALGLGLSLGLWAGGAAAQAPE